MKLTEKQFNKNANPEPPNCNYAKEASKVAAKANSAEGREYEKMARSQEQKGGC